MYAAIYRLREHGIKLPKPKDAISGELRLRPHQVGTNDPHALMAELLLDDGGLALPPLHRAVVRHITKGGMVIRGHEMHSRGGPKGRVQTYLQTWWCLVLTEAVMQEVFDLNLVGLP
jgi:hypothetical protein